MTTKTFTFAPAEGITANVRAAELDGAWWFHGPDVCRALGLRDKNGAFHNHYARLSSDERRVARAGDLDPLLKPGDSAAASGSPPQRRLFPKPASTR
ncbi:MAG: hypothetical protein DI601_13620 [Azospirillum brasilense]|nr:MAG: hypothetical protein DI601_13620 [Azospirillum brasilense]